MLIRLVGLFVGHCDTKVFFELFLSVALLGGYKLLHRFSFTLRNDERTIVKAPDPLKGSQTNI